MALVENYKSWDYTGFMTFLSDSKFTASSREIVNFISFFSYFAIFEFYLNAELLNVTAKKYNKSEMKWQKQNEISSKY